MLSSSYLKPLSIPPLVATGSGLATADGVQLVSDLRADMMSNLHISASTASALIPVVMIKHTEKDDTLDCATTNNESKVAVERGRALLNKWPDEFAGLTGKFLWLNNVGDVISPIWQGRATMLGEPEWVISGIIGTWQNTTVDKMQAVFWLKSGPAMITARFLPLLLLSMLPHREYFEALATFTNLGQSFMRYVYYWAKHAGDARGASVLVTAFPNIARFGIYGTEDVVKALHDAAFTR